MNMIKVKILERVSIELIICLKRSNIKTIATYFELGSLLKPEEDPRSKYVAIVLIFDLFRHIISSMLTLSKILY